MSEEFQWKVLGSKLIGSICISTLSLFISTASAQDLCNTPAGTEKGSFALLTPAVGCSPFNVKIQDISGGTDIQYYYSYTGQPAGQLGTLTPTTATEETYFAATKPTVFTILQKGKKNGKDMYACKNITVRPNSQPLFTYNSCNNTRLEINIPDSTLNDFDYYEIDWGIARLGGGRVQRVQKAELPLQVASFYSTNTVTKDIKIEGFYQTPVGCASPSYQTIQMNGRANQPNITTLELLSGNKQVKIDFTGAYGQDYQLYQREGNNSYSFGNFTTSLKPGIHTVNVTGDEQNCFLLYKNTGCQEISGEVCAIKLDSITVDGRQNVIEWDTHIAANNAILGGGVYNAQITSRIEKIVRVDSAGGIFEVVSPAFNPYNDDVDCSEPYCYRIETKVVGVRAGSLSIPFESKSLSAISCIDRTKLVLPAITDAYSSVNAPNSVEISYTDNSGWNLIKEKFRLLRFNGSEFIPTDSTSSILGFIDANTSTNDFSYCYKINYTDECGSTSLNSPTFCTIHLSSENQKEINWTPESPYADEVPVTYEVIYFDETIGSPLNEIDYPFPTETHTVNLDLFEEFARYQIKAVDINGVESLSNIIEIPIQASIFLPNAFTPNGDNINNEFIISGKTKRITDYQFVIYNRWGEEVFSTEDLSIGWNGRVSNETAPIGHYTYRINAKTNTGEIIQKKGVVLLMR
jgi:gliding motility-associated-like protein